MNEKQILDQVKDYYSSKIREHGVSAKGVDWNSEASQNLRFVQLLKVINESSDFSVLDYGCGYGAMLEMVKQDFRKVQYFGFDISEEMLLKAREIFGENDSIIWASNLGSQEFDYVVSSGIFNVKLNQDQNTWLDYIVKTLEDFNQRSKKGFSFNMLSKYSDREYMRDYLYYADPSFFLDYCKREFSKYVAVLHDYALYEFTIIVKKNI
ncbi:MAG: class I SAM-dependent methyltransferase [Cyclobacteriaceae bacterium]|nr:class I SAM-dependent methyltransferase [Cyclobacteriaceae bacterium]